MSTEPTKSEDNATKPVVGVSGSESRAPESMSKKIMVAIIVAIVGAVVGAVATALIQPAVQVRRQEEASSKMRRDSNVAELMGSKWAADWYFDDDKNRTLHDTVTFSNWTKDNLFVGFGEITYPNKQYKYSITGEVSPIRVVILNYKAEQYPTETNIGTACLQISGNAEDLAGTWVGLEYAKQPDGTEMPKLHGGKVKMHRIRNANS
jgi:hypothetical protein